MFDIEKQHHDNVADLHRLAGLALGNTDDVARQIEIGMMTQEIEKAIDKAKLYDLMQLKRSQGGKKSANNMTAEERKARALKASHARKSKQNGTARKTNIKKEPDYITSIRRALEDDNCNKILLTKEN